MGRAPREGRQWKAESPGNEPRPRCHTAGSPRHFLPEPEPLPRSARSLWSSQRPARPAKHALNDRPHLEPVSASSHWILSRALLSWSRSSDSSASWTRQRRAGSQRSGPELGPASCCRHGRSAMNTALAQFYVNRRVQPTHSLCGSGLVPEAGRAGSYISHTSKPLLTQDWQENQSITERRTEQVAYEHTVSGQQDQQVNSHPLPL